MILPEIALKKGRQVVGHNIQSWAKQSKVCRGSLDSDIRCYGTERGLATQLREELAKEHVKDLSKQQKAKKEARAIDKDFFMSVLGSSATKREARSYLQRFTPSKDSQLKPKFVDTKPVRGNEVNLGGLYGPTAVEQSPQFIQQPDRIAKLPVESQLHIALVKLRAPQTLDDETLTGIGRTLSQLGRLGLISVVVLDCNVEATPVSGRQSREPDWRQLETAQANRLVAAIDGSGEADARLVDNVIGISESPGAPAYAQTKTHITLRKLLMTPLRRGIIPVIPSVGYTDVSQTAVPVDASDIVLALTKELAGIPSALLPDEDPNDTRDRLRALREEVSLDRLIILDPLGGVPALDRPNGYHVFLNMEQEFEPAKEQLQKVLQENEEEMSLGSESIKRKVTDLAMGNPFSKFAETEFGVAGRSVDAGSLPEIRSKSKTDTWHHLQNLQLVRSVLAMLPPSSSALLTTPEEAANSGKDVPFQAARVGTRRQRNPLIHNLLTDKPVFSSSLPVGRLGPQVVVTEPVSPAESITPTTFAKHGISVTIFPDPRISPWEPPMPGKSHLTLTDSQIDLPRLVHLIEDSFGRKLDVEDYLKRVDGRIAGVIIAGEYEGGALLTWETPPGVEDDGSPESRARMVPYLDKFAVLKRAQGSGGVADLIFKAMVRDCFPDGCVWRSRRNNPVNKWYFERSRGTWKLPGTGWAMFWTTPELSMDKQLFLDYEGVCRGIEPSWADNKAVLD
ncbi:mitochondrial amino-acid acetyltransferase [Mollisia scopiformis]|uniref:Amino-acid acetyltransferase, mitochondrial n=1 Tax=Mollisia scopiformis TaxID=149040 RepID=A0A194X9J0_MOLSC|nr:mitochondrial amino-acid acetyltransferase [Mollisia scopiformis]KUJ16845.1 mitochondrial amino-acid acetyltransferase [Mollisia scopiformis]